MLYWYRPGGMGLGSRTERTPSMYAEFLVSHGKEDEKTIDSPLLEVASLTFAEPGSDVPQYNVFVYGCTQKKRLCLRSPCPLPMVRRVYLYKNSPIIVCVIAWMTVGSVATMLWRLLTLGRPGVPLPFDCEELGANRW
jgi:hypothetical protein